MSRPAKVHKKKKKSSSSSGGGTGSNSKSKRKSRRPVPPAAPGPTLHDVMNSEVAKGGGNELDHQPQGRRSGVVVNKGEPSPPVVIPEEQQQQQQQPVAQVATAAAAAAAVASDGGEEDHGDGDGESGDVVTSKEVLETVENVAQQAEAAEGKKKGRSKTPRARGGNGDFGAAYHELYTQLCLRMLNRIYRYFQKLYSKVDGNTKKYKRELENIQRWNQSEINRRAKEILKIYPDTESYFRYAYAANVMLMSVVVQKDADSEDVEIEVPKFSEFILKSYVESARVLYDNSSVMSPDMSDRDKLRVREELFSCFSKAIATALRMMVPLEAIAPRGSTDAEPLETFGDSESEVESVDSEEEESDSESEDEEEESGSESGSGSGSEEEDDEESGSGSEEDDESGSAESESASGSDFDDDESDERGYSSSDQEEAPRRSRPSRRTKRVKASKKALQTPDALSIDQGLSYY